MATCERNRWLTLFSIGLLALLLLACDVSQLTSLFSTAPVVGKTKGNANASVTVIEISDFQ
jgi:hypothetical protein